MMAAAERAAHALFLERLIPANVALTLCWNADPISRDRIRRDLRGFHARLDRELYGPRFHKRPPNQRTRFWAAIELADSYAHVHVGMHVADPAALRSMLASGLFLQFAPAGSYDCQPHRHGWSGYAVKALRDTADLILSSEFVPAA